MVDLYELAGADPSVRFSPFCWRVRMALAHKGVEPRFIPWHYGEKKLPKGNDKVPVLVDDGKVIADSGAIARHLENSRANCPSLFGCDTGEAHTSFIAAWTDAVLQPALFPIIVMDVYAQIKPEARDHYRSTREARLGSTLEKAAERREDRLPALRTTLEPLRVAVKQAEFVGGSEPTYADYCVFGAFMWVRCASGFEVLEEDDPVYDWRERMLDLFDGMARGARTAAG